MNKTCFPHYITAMMLVLPQLLMASIIETHVSSFGTYNFAGKHFCILSSMENVSNDDVEFLEYAKYISYAFQMRGGIEVSHQSDSAEVCILLGYDIKDASYTRTVSEPIWGQTSVASVTGRNSGSDTKYYYNYNYGVVNYRQSQQLVNKFVRYVDLFCYEISPNERGNQKMVWKAYAKSEGSGDNLSKVFPFMAVTLYDVLGEKTTDYWFRISDDNWYVYFFQKGVLLKNNHTFCPNVDNGSKQTSYAKGRDDYWLWNVYKGDSATIVCLELDWILDDNDLDTYYMFYKNTYISWNGTQFRCTGARNLSNEKEIKLGNNNVAKSSTQRVYLALYFSPLPKDADIIDIVSQKKQTRSKDDLVWKGVHLRNW